MEEMKNTRFWHIWRIWLLTHPCCGLCTAIVIGIAVRCWYCCCGRRPCCSCIAIWELCPGPGACCCCICIHGFWFWWVDLGCMAAIPQFCCCWLWWQKAHWFWLGTSGRFIEFKLKFCWHWIGGVYCCCCCCTPLEEPNSSCNCCRCCSCCCGQFAKTKLKFGLAIISCWKACCCDSAGDCIDWRKFCSWWSMCICCCTIVSATSNVCRLEL